MARGNSGVQWWRNGHPISTRRTGQEARGRRRALPPPAGPRRQALVAHVERRREDPLLRPTTRRLQENLPAPRRTGAGRRPSPISVPRRPRAVPVDRARRLGHRLRTRLRPLGSTGNPARPPGFPSACAKRARLGRRPPSARDEFQQPGAVAGQQKVAIVAAGEVAAAPAKDGGPAHGGSPTPAASLKLYWGGPDSRRLVCVAQRGLQRLMAYDPPPANARAPMSEAWAYPPGRQTARR